MSSNLNWPRLLSLAEGEVTDVLQGLAPALRKQAERVTVIYERKPSRKLIADGIEEDTLGLFVGPDFAEELHAAPVPQQIILYLENIWDIAEDDDQFFREDVRDTFLHELGHYLGLDEDDLTDRGLD